MSFNETKHHGTADFPVELYILDLNHPKYEMAFHWHTAIEIIRISDGKLDISLNSHAVCAEKGDIIIVNSETVHGAIPHDCKYECIVFHPEEFISGENSCRSFVDFLLNGSVRIAEYFPSGSAPYFESVVSEIIIRMTEKNDGYNFAVIGLIYKLFSLILENKLYTKNANDASERDVVRLKTALRYIRDNYNKNLRLEDIAVKVSMSPKYFCRFFKDMTDKTPIEYLIAYRIERAARMLISGNESITEVAFACGFSDVSYFTKLFKRHKGVTPRQFKKNNNQA